MLIKRPDDIKSSEITDEKVYHDRRRLIRSIPGLLLAAGTTPGLILAQQAHAAVGPAAGKYKHVKTGKFSADEQPTPYKHVTSYNNFYEFGTSKSDPAHNAGNFRTSPWSIRVEGEAGKPGVYGLEDFINPAMLEERVYRLRCVEGWSMVIPWIGFPLHAMLKRFEPTSKAKYVEFTTLNDPVQMKGQRRAVLDWPYVEGLRMDEAMHPLAFMAVGLYGDVLPNQNGAPIRLVVPWKYGFKSIKSIVRIRFTEQQPVSSWTRAAPNEYGFYSNVNPEVDHPRWSQARERRIGEDSFFTRKRKTLMFNGYADQVASLYTGMDLKKNF